MSLFLELCNYFATILLKSTWLVSMDYLSTVNWIREVNECGETKLDDVDGSYLPKKRVKLLSDGVSPLGLSLPGLPEPPLSGWEFVDHINYQTMAKKLPKVTPGIL